MKYAINKCDDTIVLTCTLDEAKTLTFALDTLKTIIDEADFSALAEEAERGDAFELQRWETTIDVAIFAHQKHTLQRERPDLDIDAEFAEVHAWLACERPDLIVSTEDNVMRPRKGSAS